METSNRLNWPRRRVVLGWTAMALAATPFATALAESPLSIRVWKDPGCGCCKDWIAHMERDGFAVQVFDGGNQAARSRLGLPARYGSCQTALIDGYVIEGNVPAAAVRRLLAQRPAAIGLAVPLMPIDEPAYGGRRDPFEVLLVHKDGSARVFNFYP